MLVLSKPPRRAPRSCPAPPARCRRPRNWAHGSLIVAPAWVSARGGVGALAFRAREGGRAETKKPKLDPRRFFRSRSPAACARRCSIHARATDRSRCHPLDLTRGVCARPMSDARARAADRRRPPPFLLSLISPSVQARCAPPLRGRAPAMSPPPCAAGVLGPPSPAGPRAPAGSGRAAAHARRSRAVALIFLPPPPSPATAARRPRSPPRLSPSPKKNRKKNLSPKPLTASSSRPSRTCPP